MSFWTVPGQLRFEGNINAFHLVCLKLFCIPCCSKTASLHLKEDAFSLPLLYSNMKHLRMSTITKKPPNNGDIMPKSKCKQ